MFDGFQTVENEGIRAKLGMKAGQGGALVNTPYRTDSEYPLKEWDIVTRIGDHDIGSDGRVAENTISSGVAA